ncbi:MAG: Bax inhibitor-1/YccA family protein [Candidatus Xenobia bacterium]
MSQAMLQSPTERGVPVERLAREARGTFLVRVYGHLYGAVMAFAAIDYMLFASGVARPMARAMLGTNWLLVLAGFMGASWLATHFARSSNSRSMQYFGLATYVVAEAVLFVPLLFIAQAYAPGAIGSAIYATVIGFTALTAIVAVTGKDFSFLRSILMWGGIASLGLIVVACLGGMSLGVWFDLAMIAFAGAAILYDTSKVLKGYREDDYVGAALQLFASVALLFWYVLRLFMGSRR